MCAGLDTDLPIFSQTDCLEEDQCDVCVKVDFPKDGADDIVCLHSTEVDTILEGHLKKESDVGVTVILPDEDNEATVSIPKVLVSTIFVV